LQQQTTVEIEPQSALIDVTRRVPHHRPLVPPQETEF
jgi:hypothetical protein